MKKANWYIAKSMYAPEENKRTVYFESVTGYMENFVAPDGTKITLGFRKDGCDWTCDELSTGASVGMHGATRKEVFGKIEDSLLQTLADFFKNKKIVEAQGRLKEYILSSNGKFELDRK